MTRSGCDAQIKINGETRPLRLTLGALADIEAAFGGDFEALKARLESPRVGDLLVILHALLKGGGAALTIEALKAADIDFAEAGAAIARAFAAFSAEQETPPGKPQGEKVASPGATGSPPESSS
ncbi:MAG: gene transfer agent family protein [Parvularculaceae bacterium]